jgi:2-dehydro-3-deoxyphosphogalactonate aldolase
MPLPAHCVKGKAMSSSDNVARFAQAITAMPIVAIVRGVKPDEVAGIAQAIYDAGIRVIEVPLNSPDPLVSIEKLAAHFGDRAIVGAGTVLTIGDVADCKAAGAQIIVSPNMNADVVRATVAAGMISAPGCLTPTEAFAALDAGAHAVKLFPGELVSAAAVKAMRAVLPKDAIVLVVGGVSADHISSYRDAGASGFGIGGGIYRAGYSAEQARTNAAAFVAAIS